MTPSLKSTTLQLLKRFNKAFPQFYEQFVSSDMQLQNLQLAYRLYNTQQAVVEVIQSGDRSTLYFVFRNHSYLLRDIFGVLVAFGLTIHNVSLYGQVQAPMLVFIQLELSKGGKSLAEQAAGQVCRGIRDVIAGKLEIDRVLSAKFNLNRGLGKVETDFYIDPVFNLPTLLIEADSQQDLFYRVADAIWHEDLLIVNASVLAWRGQKRLILYLLGPDESTIPEYLGQKIADGVKRRLKGQLG
jgi:hypothetical protein